MAGQRHVLRLGPNRIMFWDPITGLDLSYPERMVGEVPADADLTNIMKALKSGGLIDVNGTILGESAVEKEPEVKITSEVKEEQAAENSEPAAEAEVFQTPAAAESDESDEPAKKATKKKR